jgi:hypothetical protein
MSTSTIRATLTNRDTGISTKVHLDVPNGGMPRISAKRFLAARRRINGANSPLSTNHPFMVVNREGECVDVIESGASFDSYYA